MKQFFLNALMLVTGVIVAAGIMYGAISVAMIWPSEGTKLGAVYLSIAGFGIGAAILCDAVKRVFQ